MPHRARASITRAIPGLAVTVGLAVTLGLAAACGGPAKAPGTVVYASGADLESANPLVTVHGLSRQIQRFALFTTLARYDSALNATPYLARAWHWSEDRFRLTLQLNAGVAWHDGMPTTAHDVAFTLLVARDPRTGFARSADLAAIDTVTTPDDSTVTVEFDGPQPRFPPVFCELPILPAHLLGSVPRGDMRHAPFNLAPTGNGPFRFVERIPGQRWVFERNAMFPAALGGPPAVERFVVVVVDEPTTKLAGLTSGDLDFAGIAPTMASLAARDPTVRVVDYPILLSTALVFNTHRPPFDDARVRAAVNASLDRERIVRAALAGYGKPAAGPVPAESPLAIAATPVHDARLADSLLDAAGWLRAGDGRRMREGTPFRVELLTVGSGDNAAEQLIQADLATRGITVEIRQLEMGAFLTRARSRPKAFDLLVTGIPGDLALSFLGAMYDSRQRGGALDYGDYHTSELDSLFARARRVNDNDLPAVWHSVQQILVRDLPAAWIYHSRGLQGVSRRIENVTMDLRGELASLARWRPGAP